MKTARILLAEADPARRVFWGKALRRGGFEVTTAGDGLGCVAQLRARPPDALVLDPDLPWGGGEGVLAMMFEDETVPVLPVVAVGSDPGGAGSRSVGVFPVRHYLVRPVPPQLLVQSVRLALRGRPPARRDARFPSKYWVR